MTDPLGELQRQKVGGISAHMLRPTRKALYAEGADNAVGTERGRKPGARFDRQCKFSKGWLERCLGRGGVAAYQPAGRA